MGKSFTHFDAAGKAAMVDVGAKPETNREAVALGEVSMAAAAYQMVKDGSMGKGDVLGVARLAGIMAAKKVDELIPLAHPLLISRVTVSFRLDDQRHRIEIEARVACSGRTGVEMEALTAVAITALTIYDMCKSVDKGIVISRIRLMSKSGGKSGVFLASDSEE